MQTLIFSRFLSSISHHPVNIEYDHPKYRNNIYIALFLATQKYSSSVLDLIDINLYLD